MNTTQQIAAAAAGELITHYLRVACQAAGAGWDGDNEGEMGRIREAFAEMVPAAPDGHPAAFIPVAPEAAHQLHRRFLEAEDAHAPAEDVRRLLDDWFTELGFPTVLHREEERS